MAALTESRLDPPGRPELTPVWLIQGHTEPACPDPQWPHPGTHLAQGCGLTPPGLPSCLHSPWPSLPPRPGPEAPLTWLAVASGGEPLAEDGVREEVGGKGVAVPEEQGRAALVEASQPLLTGHRGQAVQRPAVLGPRTCGGPWTLWGHSRGPRGRGSPLLRLCLSLQADLGHLSGGCQEHLQQRRGGHKGVPALPAHPGPAPVSVLFPTVTSGSLGPQKLQAGHGVGFPAGSAHPPKPVAPSGTGQVLGKGLWLRLMKVFNHVINMLTTCSCNYKM